MRFKFVSPELQVDKFESLFPKLVINGYVEEILQSNTLDDRKIISTNPFLACFSNKFKTAKSQGKKLLALCKTQNATKFVQSVLAAEHSTELISKSPTNVLRDGANGKEQKRQFLLTESTRCSNRFWMLGSFIEDFLEMKSDDLLYLPRSQEHICEATLFVRWSFLSAKDAQTHNNNWAAVFANVEMLTE